MKCVLLLATVASLVSLGAPRAQWTQVSTSNAPQPRLLAPMDYDVARGQVVLFGGWPVSLPTATSTAQTLNDTWTYDGTDWTQQNPATRPPERSDCELVYDWSRNVAVLYGGAQGGLLGPPTLEDTWEWNGVDWTQRFHAVTPGPRAAYGAAYDSQRNRLVLYGGLQNIAVPIASADTWEYDSTSVTWSQVATARTPGPRERPAMAYHVGIGKTVLFGGINPQTGLFGDTWTFDGTNWTQLGIAGPTPAPRSSPQMIYDWDRQVLILYGGHDDRGNLINDTWEFDGTSWTQRTPGEPSARIQPSMAYDFARKRPVMFGGAVSAFSWGPLNDTWEYGATFASTGSGCMGTAGVPSLSARSLPRLGQINTVEMFNVSPGGSTAFFVFGFSNPGFDLTFLGMTGCILRANLDLVFPVPVVSGAASFSWRVPANPALFGAAFYNQAISVDPGANPLGLVLSDGGQATAGF